MYKRIELPYKLNELASVFSEKQLDLHYNKHHLGYETKLNAALENNSACKELTLEELVVSYHRFERELAIKIRQFGGGLINHNYFFSQFMENKPLKDGKLKEAIMHKFGSLDKMFEELLTTSMSVFGSGWGWVVIDSDKQIAITKTFNQDTTYYQKQRPLIAVDVWEHAHYIDFYNDRKTYIEKMLTILNFEFIEEKFHKYINQ